MGPVLDGNGMSTRGAAAVLDIALLRWSGPPDVPPGSRSFAYHRQLAPMCAVLLALSVIELGVVHLLVAHWSPTVATVLSALSALGLVYLVGLIKSFRLRPVLLTADDVRVRTGFLIDLAVPFDAIATVDGSVTGDEVRGPGCFNAAMLAWPNVILRLKRALPHPSKLRRGQGVSAVAFRLDDPEPFLRALRSRLHEETWP